jgi:hypothetical protein
VPNGRSCAVDLSRTNWLVSIVVNNLSGRGPTKKAEIHGNIKELQAAYLSSHLLCLTRPSIENAYMKGMTDAQKRRYPR